MSTADTVTLTRAEYQALIQRIEDAEDEAVAAAAEAREAALGKEVARADHLASEFVERLIAGEHPIRIWRAHCGLTRAALAAAAGISPSYVTEIETGRKPGSFNAIAKLAASLGVSLDAIAPWLSRTE